MLTRREISCVRCGERFLSMRRTARFCGQRCRQAANEDLHRLTSTPTPAVEEATATAVDNGEESPEVVEEEEDLHGWRRLGGYLVPPFDPRNVFHTDDWPR
jgi:predicted  nucleic acid-binding Zn-ribbon protein